MTTKTTTKLPPGIYLRNGKYQVRTYEGGRGSRPISRSFLSLREAKAFKAQIEAAKAKAGGQVNLSGGQVRTGDYVREWLNSRPANITPSTRSNYESHVVNWIDPDPEHRARYPRVPWISDTPLNKLTRSEVQRWINSIAEHRAPSTVHGIFTVVNAALRLAHHDGVIPQLPTARVELPEDAAHQVESLTIAEVAELAEAVGPTYRNLVWLVALTGLRISEAVGLTEDRVGSRDGRTTIKVDRQLPDPQHRRDADGNLRFDPPKTKHSYRTIPVGRVVEKIISAQIESGVAEAGLLFVNRNGDPADPHNLHQRSWAVAVERVLTPERIEQVRQPHDAIPGLHALRHAFTDWLRQAGADSRTIADLVGHSESSMTMGTYASTLFSLLVDAVDAVEAAVVPYLPDDLRPEVEVGEDAVVVEFPTPALDITTLDPAARAELLAALLALDEGVAS